MMWSAWSRHICVFYVQEESDVKVLQCFLIASYQPLDIYDAKAIIILGILSILY